MFVDVGVMKVLVPSSGEQQISSCSFARCSSVPGHAVSSVMNYHFVVNMNTHKPNIPGLVILSSDKPLFSIAGQRFFRKSPLAVHNLCGETNPLSGFRLITNNGSVRFVCWCRPVLTETWEIDPSTLRTAQAA